MTRTLSTGSIGAFTALALAGCAAGRVPTPNGDGWFFSVFRQHALTAKKTGAHTGSVQWSGSPQSDVAPQALELAAQAMSWRRDLDAVRADIAEASTPDARQRRLARDFQLHPPGYWPVEQMPPGSLCPVEPVRVQFVPATGGMGGTADAEDVP